MNINDIALTLEAGVGVKTATALINTFGTADAIYAASASELILRGGLKPALAAQLTRREAHKQAERELAYLKKHNLTAIASTDEVYPSLLREMNDFPHVLYVRGNVEALNRRCVSMVGTRKISAYGQTMCDRLVRDLSERVPDLCIVSGLAFGVDAHCHRAALRYKVPTVAVIASTLPDVTPAQNSALARDMIDNGGAIVSERHSNSKQTGDFYLSRNRIIAGISEGTVVVEAPRESGALSTADFATSYNRTVMAVPARATDETSYGSNGLITRQQAAAVGWGEDIIRALAWDLYVPGVGERPTAAKPELSDDEQALLKFFPAGEAISVDTLAELSGLGHTALASLLLTLELTKMVISRLPGGSYIKI